MERNSSEYDTSGFKQPHRSGSVDSWIRRGIEVLQTFGSAGAGLRVIGPWVDVLRAGRTGLHVAGAGTAASEAGRRRKAFQYVNLISLNYDIGPGKPQLDDAPQKPWQKTAS